MSHDGSPMKSQLDAALATVAKLKSDLAAAKREQKKKHEAVVDPYADVGSTLHSVDDSARWVCMRGLNVCTRSVDVCMRSMGVCTRCACIINHRNYTIIIY